MAFKLKSIAPSEVYDPALDGLRGLAVLIVMYAHTLTHSRRMIVEDWVTVGDGAAALFFVLSAFTLARSTEKRMSLGEGLIPDFYIRRFFRIFPLWWFFLAVALILRPFFPGEHPEVTTQTALMNFLMIFGFVPGFNFTIVGWTLFVEEVFYLFFPFLFLFIKLERRKGISLLMVTAFILFRLLWFAVAERFPLPQLFIDRFPLAHFYELGLGLAVYEYRDSITKNEYVLGAAGLLSAALIVLCTGVPQAFGAAVLVLTSVRSQGVLRKVISFPVLKVFGITCYSVYLAHSLIIKFLPVKLVFGSPLLSVTLGWVCLATLSFLVALVTFNFIERPGLRLGKWAIGPSRHRSETEHAA